MIPRKSPFKFAFSNSYVHKKIKISENNEDIEDYASQDHKMLNTMEATTHFCATTKSSWLLFVTSKSFPMRHCMTLYLEGYQK